MFHKKGEHYRHWRFTLLVALIIPGVFSFLVFFAFGGTIVLDSDYIFTSSDMYSHTQADTIRNPGIIAMLGLVAILWIATAIPKGKVWRFLIGVNWVYMLAIAFHCAYFSPILRIPWGVYQVDNSKATAPVGVTTKIVFVCEVAFVIIGVSYGLWDNNRRKKERSIRNLRED